jgi:DNA-binding response OmpR family regulator
LAKILVVDDEPMIAMLVADWLADVGHEPVGPALTLTEAMALLDHAFDAAIVDLALGAESGRPIAEALAAKGTPFIYATAQAGADLDDLPPSMGLLTKPYSCEALTLALKPILSSLTSRS